MAIKSIKLNVIGRVIAGIIAIVFIFAAYNIIQWGLGRTIAQNTNSKEVADYAVELAPSDAETYYRLAALNEKSFLPDDLPKALKDYEKAVSLAPNDYRLWLALGKIRERTGDGAGAEKAMRKALELAPNYSEVHWTLGNTLLRQGNTDEAFIQIRKAVDNDSTYAAPAVVTAWQTFDGDVAEISKKIGDSTPIKAGLAPYLAKQQKFDEAFAFWNTVPDIDKSTTYKKTGEDLVGSLVEGKKFREALTVQTQISSSDSEKFAVGNIFNNDFEKDVKMENASLFDWRIAGGSQPQIGLDSSQKHGGSRSLVVIFNSQTGQEFRPIQQTVVVESGKAYKLEGFYRTELKNSLLTLKWDITDANDGKVLASTNEIDANSTNWATLTASFTTLPTTQAIIIKLSPVPCKQGLCPISGRIWFDDFSLK